MHLAFLLIGAMDRVLFLRSSIPFRPGAVQPISFLMSSFIPYLCIQPAYGYGFDSDISYSQPLRYRLTSCHHGNSHRTHICAAPHEYGIPTVYAPFVSEIALIDPEAHKVVSTLLTVCPHAASGSILRHRFVGLVYHGKHHLRLLACTGYDTKPAASISLKIQRQLPLDSTTTDDPGLYRKAQRFYIT